ncbi:GNAT family N-acetyltransferase [Pseudonocardia sp. TRM90224]|uniref:GNAT family N-acetyltransferase n=1 Tax=Pseudonocardia sp. TRM90224 TaxID=2812678 RepID=UPI001E40F460|nr:GNAT family N-acetyltransferase [Pseudonocardia sp. TRM90224]
MFTGRVGHPDPQYIGAVAQVLTRAFADDPVISWILPDPATRERRLRGLFDVQLRHFHATNAGVLSAGDPAAPAGAAIWEPPGHPMRLPAMLRALPGVLSSTGRDGFRRVRTILSRFGAVHPHRPHWYLGYLGTDPDQQGTGVGSALMRPTLAYCDATGLPAYLESSDEKNVGFYERFGFVVTGEVRLPDGPRVPLMWREPR